MAVFTKIPEPVSQVPKSQLLGLYGWPPYRKIRVVRRYNPLKEKVVNNQVNEQDPQENTGAFIHRALRERKKINEHRTDPAKSHRPEHSRVDHSLRQIRGAWPEKLPQHRVTGVDKKQFIPNSNQVDADKEPEEFADVRLRRQRPVKRHLGAEHTDIKRERPPCQRRSEQCIEKLERVQLVWAKRQR